MLREATAILTFAVAVQYGALTVRFAGETYQAHRHWSRVPAFVTSTAAFPNVEVELKPGELESRRLVHADVDYFLAPFQHRDVLIDPRDPSRGRLTGFFETVTPLAAFLAALAGNLIVTGLILKAPALKQFQDPVPAEWAGRWNWFSPLSRQESRDAPTLRQPASAWKMNAFWAFLGLVVILALYYSDRPLWIRQCQPAIFLLFFLGMTLSAIHNKTYALTVGDDGLRARSALGWKQIPWTRIARLEDETFRFLEWSTITRSYQNRGFQSPLRSLVLRDATGAKLTSIDKDLQPRETLNAVVSLISERTGLRPVSVEKSTAL